MAKIELKQPVVEEIKENIKDAKSVVLVDYRGLTVDQDTQLRKSMREADVIYKVYKNTMVKLAIAGTEFESLKDELEGPRQMQQLLQDWQLISLRRTQRLNLRVVLLRVLITTQTALRKSLQFLPETNLSLSSLEASSHQLQTLLVLLSRSLKRTKKLLNFRVRIQNVSMEMLNRVCTDTVWTVRAAAQ